MWRFSLVAIFLLSLVSDASTAPPQDRKALISKTLPSIVTLTVRNASGEIAARGSGVVISRNLIATSLHVVWGAHSVTANYQNGRSEEVVGIAEMNVSLDIALLLSDTSGVRPLPTGDTSTLEAGEDVIAIGAPQGLSGTTSIGVVSSVRGGQALKLIQTTASISAGSSGGPLLNSKGQVIGINSFFFTEGQNLNFAIPVFYAKSLIRKETQYWSWDTLSDFWGSKSDTPEAPSSQADAPETSSSLNATDSIEFIENQLATLTSVSLEVEELPEAATDAGLTEKSVEDTVASALKGSGVIIGNDPDDPLLYIRLKLYARPGVDEEDEPDEHLGVLSVQCFDYIEGPSPNAISKRVYAWFTYYESDYLVIAPQGRAKTRTLDLVAAAVSQFGGECKRQRETEKRRD